MHTPTNKYSGVTRLFSASPVIVPAQSSDLGEAVPTVAREAASTEGKPLEYCTGEKKT